MGWLENLLGNIGIQNTAGMAPGGSQALRAGGAYNAAPPQAQAAPPPMPSAPPPQMQQQSAPPPFMDRGPYQPYQPYGGGGGGPAPMPQAMPQMGPPRRSWLDDFRGMSPEQIDAGLSQMQQQAAATGRPNFDSVINGMQMRYGLQEDEAGRAYDGLMAYRNGGQLMPTQMAQGFGKFEDGSIGAGSRPYPRQYRAPKDDPNWKPLTADQEAQGYFMYEDGSVGRRPQFRGNGANSWQGWLQQHNEMGAMLKRLGLLQ